MTLFLLIVRQIAHSVTFNIFAGGSYSPHHRETPKHHQWDATASLTANQRLHNRKYQQHYCRTPGTRPNLLSSRRKGDGHLKLRSHPPQTNQMPGRRRFLSRPLTTPSLPVRPTRFVSYCSIWLTMSAERINLNLANLSLVLNGY